MLPEAEFAFVAEVFKANRAMLNALLTLVNERLLHNDGQAIQRATAGPRSRPSATSRWSSASGASSRSSPSPSRMAATWPASEADALKGGYQRLQQGGGVPRRRQQGWSKERPSYYPAETPGFACRRHDQARRSRPGATGWVTSAS